METFQNWIWFIVGLCVANLFLLFYINYSLKNTTAYLIYSLSLLGKVAREVEPISKIEQEQKELSDNYTYTSYTYRRLIPRKKIHKNLSIFGRGKKMFRN